MDSATIKPDGVEIPEGVSVETVTRSWVRWTCDACGRNRSEKADGLWRVCRWLHVLGRTRRCVECARGEVAMSAVQGELFEGVP